MSLTLALFGWLLLGLPSRSFGQTIPIQLLFDGKPLDTTARPEFSCLDTNRSTWIGCRVTTDRWPDRYVMPRLAPGGYLLHVTINENRGNPARFPGDYDVFHRFEVVPDTALELRVDMAKLIRLRSPWDNGDDMVGMLTGPRSGKPSLVTSRQSATAAVTFSWDPVASGATYTYFVVTTRDSPYARGPEVVRGTTARTSITLRLTESSPGHYFEFGLSAHKAGHQVGELFTHDSGAQGWTARFVVRGPSSAETARASRAIEPPSAAASPEIFRTEWKALPKPSWWDSVPRSPLTIRSMGDLMAVWQSGTNDELSRRRFQKLTYQAILDRPEDRELAAAGVELMAATADPEQRLPLLKFGVEHFFDHEQRTDNCANCRRGDRTGQIVRDLAYAYIANGEPRAAIAIIERLVLERDADVSPYNLALTFEAMASAYWNLKDLDGAKAAIQEGLRRFPSGWQADQLRRALDRYEKLATQPAQGHVPEMPLLVMDRLREQCQGFGVVSPGTGPSDYRDCRLTESGELALVDEEPYYYGLYCLMPSYAGADSRCGDGSFDAEYHRARGVAVFARDASTGDVRLLFERAEQEIATIWARKPAVVRSAAATILYLPIVVDGTGAGNASEYYVRTERRWEPIDATSWLADLGMRIPAGLQIWKGVWPDLEMMRAEAGLYRAGDANCCPTGGTARIQLALRARQFVIESVAIENTP